MADLNGYVDENAKPSEGRDPIPPGTYKAMVVASDVKDNSNKNGKVLKLEWQVLEGEYTNRKIFQNINLTNPNQQAQEIGQRDLAAVRAATGKLSIRDSNELHNIPCMISVKIRPAEGKYPASNDISSVKPCDGQTSAPAAPTAPAPQQQPPQQTPPQTQQRPATTAPSGKPPWQRK